MAFEIGAFEVWVVLVEANSVAAPQVVDVSHSGVGMHDIQECSSANIHVYIYIYIFIFIFVLFYIYIYIYLYKYLWNFHPIFWGTNIFLVQLPPRK